jgi:hypothetical protein
MTSAASRISARRKWPSPLALRADLGSLVEMSLADRVNRGLLVHPKRANRSET